FAFSVSNVPTADDSLPHYIFCICLLFCMIDRRFTILFNTVLVRDNCHQSVVGIVCLSPSCICVLLDFFLYIFFFYFSYRFFISSYGFLFSVYFLRFLFSVLFSSVALSSFSSIASCFALS